MSLQERLLSDMKQAMRDKEAGKLKLTVIRMVRASIKNAEINLKRELNEEELLEVIAKEVKQRRDAIPEYENANRLDVVNGLKEEINILMEYMPEQLTEAEIKVLVEEAIAGVGAVSPKDMGKVMGRLMPKVKGKADGKVVNKIVAELLGNN